MGKILYIGKYSDGQTSKMRGETLKSLFPAHDFQVIDTDLIYNNSFSVLKTIAFRYKMGPVIKRINDFVTACIEREAYDLIWVDKGIFIEPATTEKLRELTEKLVHYTPDAAFILNRSKLFEQSLPMYDYAITTKSFEFEHYKNHIGEGKTIFCTQGFDPQIHKQYCSFEEKTGVVFIGHHEIDREAVIQQLLENGITVKLAGTNWDRFAIKNKANPYLIYLGKGVFGEAYAKLISSGLISIGLLSKYIPEKHTTRTFEIPACGTALLTEKTDEVTAIFNESQAYFFEDFKVVGQQIKQILANQNRLRLITVNGTNRVISGGFDYRSIIQGIIKKIGLECKEN